MNKQRRKEIRTVISGLEEIKANISIDDEVIAEKLNDLCADVYSIMSDEEEYRDNMPENLQYSSKYESADEACDNLYNAIDEIENAAESVDDKDEVIKSINDAIGYLNEAI